MTTKLRRRLEMIIGGPSRPFFLTVQEADLLRDALDDLGARFSDSHDQPIDEEDLAASEKILGEIAGLKARLLIFMGFSH